MAKAVRVNRPYKGKFQLGIHNYIVQIINPSKRKGKPTGFWYKYVRTERELRAIRAKLKAGQIMEVFKAKHTFVSAWYKDIK